MKVVLDTNIWLSALLWGGLPDQITQIAEIGQIQIFSSEPLLTELANTLTTTKIQRRIDLIGITAESVYLATRRVVTVVPIEELTILQLRDPKDVIVLATAIAANADAIISGDQDLLVLVDFAGIPILSPKEFLNRFSLGSGRE
jgi:uncharacterized protein